MARHQVAAAPLPCVVVRGNDYYMVTIVIQLWVFEDIDQAKMISIQCHIGDSEQRPGPRATVVAEYCIDYSRGKKDTHAYNLSPMQMRSL